MGSASYLRTVIVTAAVYRGFNSRLSPLLLTFRHRAGVSPYTSPFGFAETCVFSKQSVEPLSCDLQQLRTRSPTPPEAPLLPKLRGYFAEFLRQSSLDRLGILIPSTSVGLRYGHPALSLEAFLGSMGSASSPPSREAPHQLSGYCSNGFACRSSLKQLPGTSNRPVDLSSFVPPSVITNARWYWNMHQLSIAYAFRPRLRPD